MKRAIALVLLGILGVVSAQTEVAISTAAGDQLSPRVVAGSSCFFVVWQDHRAGVSNQNIFGQTVFGDGTMPGPGYPICIATGNQNAPAVAYFPLSDQFFTIWFDQAAAGELGGNFANCDGTVGGNIDVGTGTSNLFSPEIAASDEAMIFVWGVRAASWETRYAVIGTDGTMTGSPQTLSGAGSKSPDIAFNGDKFLAVWRDSSDTEQGIMGQYFNSDGTPDGEPFVIVSDAQAAEPAVCAIPGDTPGFLVVYQTRDISSPSASLDLFAVKIVGTSFTEYTITTATADQSSPDVACSGDGFFVVWQDAGTTLPSVYGQFFTMSGVPVGDAFPLDPTGTSQQAPKVDFLASDSVYLAVWTDFRTANQDIYGAILNPPTPSEGPSVAGVYPPAGAISACDSAMQVSFTAPAEIDWATLVILYDGAEYDTAAEIVWVEGNTVYFHPEYPIGEFDTITTCIEDLATVDGAHIDSAFCWTWYSDEAAPQIHRLSPTEDSLDVIPATIVYSISDIGAGVDSSSIDIDFNGAHFSLGDPGIYWDGFSLTLNISEMGYTDLPTTNVITITAQDLAECPNTAQLVDTFYIATAGEGPVATPVTPEPNSVSACSLQTITIAITDSDGVDEATIVLVVNGTRYDSLDHMSYVPPNLVFTPTEPYPEGEVTVELLSANDLEGNPLSEPLTYSFIVDRTPPQVVNATYPEGSELDTTSMGDLIITAEDNYCSQLDISRCYVRLSRVGGGLVAQWDSDALLHPADMQIGVASDDFFAALDSGHISTNDTFRVCVRLADLPDYVCPLPNIVDTCWNIIYHGSGIAETKVPEGVKLSAAPNPFNSAVEISYSAPAGGRIEIYDGYGHLIRRYPVAGSGVFVWDACDDEGLPMSSGTYTVRLRTQGGEVSTRVMLVR